MDKEIKKLCKIIGRDLAELYKGDTLSALWPFTTNEAEFYIGEFFIKELFLTINKLKEKGYSKEKIAKLFYRPAKIAQYFTLFHSAKVLKKEERMELVKDLISYIRYYREDPYCTYRKNILKRNVFDYSLLKTKTSRKINKVEEKFSALLLLYLEVLFPTAMRLGHEFHGPYKTKGGYLFIKEFYNLKVPYFEISKDFPFKKIICIERVKEKPTLDFFNHLLRMPKREESAIIVDGKLIEINEIEKLLVKIEKILQKIYRKVSFWKKEDFLILLAKGYFYSLENLKKESDEKIIIPKQFYEKIKNENFEFDIEKAKKWIEKTSIKKLRKKVEESYLKIFYE